MLGASAKKLVEDDRQGAVRERDWYDLHYGDRGSAEHEACRGALGRKAHPCDFTEPVTTSLLQI